MSQVQDNQAPYMCPRCQHEGRPYKFADDGSSQLRVLLRCENCQHRWSALVSRGIKK